MISQDQFESQFGKPPDSADLWRARLLGEEELNEHREALLANARRVSGVLARSHTRSPLLRPRRPLLDDRLDADDLIQSIEELHLLSDTGDPEERSAANRAIAEVIRTAVGPYLDQTEPSFDEKFRGARRMEQTLYRVARYSQGLLSRRPSPATRLRWRWTGVTISVAAAAAITFGMLRLGLALVLVRLAISLLLGMPGSGSDTTRIKRRYGWAGDWVGCVLGHACDALILSGIGAYLLSHERPWYGMFVFVAAQVMLLSALARVAALQQGVFIERLRLERVVRNGCILGAMLIGLFVQPTVPTEGPPLMALAGFGALAFSAVEIRRTIARTDQHWRRREDVADRYELYTQTAADFLEPVQPLVAATSLRDDTDDSPRLRSVKRAG